ncbi:hypothetical protein ACFSKL_16060 [Belliella marina]|uniref:Outer membrane protein beta-barrel domain-containing protein n=1 Tax=Belliella marina TaxID=1644146 RepID=A0ABW4VNP8_9BACT
MNLRNTAVILMLFFFSGSYLFAQDEIKKEVNPKWDIGLEGMFGVAIGNDFYAFNVGGPSLLLRLNEDWRVGFGALPSFYIKEGKTGAKLGVSPRIDYKNFVLIAPFFHFDNPDKWVWSVGLGYKFHKKK